MTSIDALDEIVIENLYEDGEDNEGFTAPERYPLNLVSLFNDPNEPSETIDKERYKTLKGFTKTRWHSILIMLESLGSQRVAVNRVLYLVKNPMTVATEEWDLIHELINFLRIFRDAVEMFSFEKKPTLSNALLFRIEIENSLKADRTDHHIIALLKKSMIAKLDKRFPVTKEMLIATLLDPRLQNLPKLLEEIRKRSISKFEFLKTECLEIIPPQVQAEVVKESVASDKKRPSTMTKLIQKHAYDNANEQSSTQEMRRVDEEIHKYFLTVIPKDEIERFDILKFWSDNCKSLPSLAELVKKYLCIPVTSTSSERAFSYAGLLINSKRSSLAPNVVEKTLFIHHNYTLVKESIFSTN